MAAIGADLHAGADLAELGRLLVDLDVETFGKQRIGGCEPTETCAGDQHARLGAHGLVILATSRSSSSSAALGLPSTVIPAMP